MSNTVPHDVLEEWAALFERSNKEELTPLDVPGMIDILCEYGEDAVRELLALRQGNTTAHQVRQIMPGTLQLVTDEVRNWCFWQNHKDGTQVQRIVITPAPQAGEWQASIEYTKEA